MKNNTKATFSKNGTTVRKIMSAAFTLMVVLVIVLVNVFSVFFVEKFPNLEADMTSDNLYSLTKTTEEYLEFLQDDINIKVLGTEDDIVGLDNAFGYQVNRLLKVMSGNKHIDLEYIDMKVESQKKLSDEYPDVDWVSLSDIILVEAKESGKYRAVAFDEVFSQAFDESGEAYISGQNVETAVLSAIQRVTSTKVVKAALNIGNGERAYYSESYSRFASLLTYNAFDLEKVDINTEIDLAEYDLIIMIAPIYDLSEETAEKINKWLENDGHYGKNFLYVPYEGYLLNSMNNISVLLQKWGMKVSDGTIMELDATKAVGSNFIHLVDYVEDEELFSLKDTSKPVLMQMCRPVEILDTQLVKPILKSSDAAVVSLFKADESGNTTMAAKDGGYAAAAVSTKSNGTGGESRVLVWGSAPSLSDEYTSLPNYSNSEYFVGFLGDMCSSRVQGIIVEAQEFDGDRMTVTQANKTAFRNIFVFVIPLGLVAAGVVVWLRRRNR